MKSWRAVSSPTQEEYAEVMSFRLGFLKPRNSSILNELEELKPLGLYLSGLREQSGNTESEVNTANSLFEGKGPEEGAVVSQGFCIGEKPILMETINKNNNNMRTIINIATVIFMVAMVVTAYMTRYGVIEEWGTVFAVDCIGLTLITVYNVFIDKQSIFYITKLMEEE